MPGEQNREQNEQNRKRGRDEAFSNPNVELAGLNKPAGQPGTSEATLSKGTFLSEDNDVFVKTPNRQTFFFPETENLNFGN